MKTTPHDEPALTTAHLPQPRGRSRWRWSTPGRAAVAGGTMAAVLGLGAGVAGATSESSASSGPNAAPASKGQPPGGTRPTVGGRITALSGDNITVRTRDTHATTVVYSAATTFTSLSAQHTNTSTSASELKVGDFIGVVGTTQSNGTVSATTITVSTGPPGGRGGPPGSGGHGGTGTGTRPAQGSAPSA